MPRSMAAFSAGGPKASKPVGGGTVRPRRRRKRGVGALRGRRTELTQSPARWRMVYYPCLGLLDLVAAGFSLRQFSPGYSSGLHLSGGPSGIRTHDLLNAIETRSQLRYGP